MGPRALAINSSRPESSARVEQQPDEAVLEAGQPLGEVGLPTELAIGVTPVDVGLLQGLHQQCQVLE